jgi:hypothetical protein
VGDLTSYLSSYLISLSASAIRSLGKSFSFPILLLFTLLLLTAITCLLLPKSYPGEVDRGLGFSFSFSLFFLPLARCPRMSDECPTWTDPESSGVY